MKVPYRFYYKGVEYIPKNTVDDMLATAKEETVNKACECLKRFFEEYEHLTDYNPIEDFRKAMEGE